MTEEEYRLKSSFRQPLIDALQSQEEGNYEEVLNFLTRTHPNERPDECIKLLKYLETIRKPYQKENSEFARKMPEEAKDAIDTALLIMADDFLSY